MSEQANVKNLRDRANQINDQVKVRLEQINKDARELYTKVEARVNELLGQYNNYEKTLETLKTNGAKLQETAKEFQEQQLQRIESFSNKVIDRLGLSTKVDVKELETKLKSLASKVNKLQKDVKTK